MLVFITPPCSPTPPERITPKLGSREDSFEGQSLPCCCRAEQHHPLGSTQDKETARPSGTSPSAPWEQPHPGRTSLPGWLPEEETRLISQAGLGSWSSGHRFPKGPSGKTSKIYPNCKCCVRDMGSQQKPRRRLASSGPLWRDSSGSHRQGPRTALQGSRDRRRGKVVAAAQRSASLAATGPSGSSELSLSGCRVILTSKW